MSEDLNNEDKKDEIKKKPELPTQTRKFEQTHKVFSDFDEKQFELTEVISGPSDYNTNIPPRMEGVIFNNDDEKVNEWARTIAQGAETTSYGEQFVDSLKNPDADFAQEIDVNGTKLALTQKRLKAVSNQELDGEKAIMFVRNTFGLGTYVDVPLFHSGFWVTLKAPSENEILELHRQITQDKIELGRATYGLVFSNQVIYFVNRLLDFALNNIQSSSIKTNKDIKDFIYSHDIPVLIWGIACTIWPNGFKYQRPCLDNPGECNHVTTELLNLHKLLWINKSQLNDWQKTHMSSKSSASVSEEDVIRYRKELLNNQPRVSVVNKNDQEISFKLRVPTATEWINEGTSWVNGIVETVTSTLSSTSSVSERNTHIIDKAKATSLQQYSHWVEEIEIETNVIKKKEAVYNTLGALSADDFIRDKFILSVKKYIDDTVISLIGVPSYNCPKCNKPQDNIDNTSPNFVNIIPIDVYTTFFIPLVQRVIKIRNR